MKIVIAGSRNYNNYAEAKEYIDFFLNSISESSPIIFISGGCRGADKLGERYAAENGYEVQRYTAEWSRLGKAAGPVRNKIMAEAADIVICFWDGRSSGTKSMIEIARGLGKVVSVKQITISQ